MPAEFERHSGCWMLWPERPDTWRAGAKPAQAAFAAVASAIATSEPVTVAVSAGQFINARAQLPRSVRVVELSSNDAWMRDCGPTFVIDGKGRRRGVDWTFNAWGGLGGGLYFPWDRDDEVAQKVLEVEGADRYRTSFVLEGGAIHVDGQGTCLTTEECLLNPNRNPGFTRDDYAEIFRRYLGVTNVLWLSRGIAGDDTHGHVDDLARFVDASTVVTVFEDDFADSNYEPLAENLALLKSMKDQDGNPLRVETLPMPEPVWFDGQRLPASYANFYIANRIVLVPTFNDANDRLALETLTAMFPDRAVIGIACRDLVLGLGTLHCMTQQQPK